MEKRKPVTSISAPTSSMARMSPWCLEGSRAWRCVEDHWWSTLHKAEAARIPGCCAHDATRMNQDMSGQRRGTTMLSRVADSLYWMSRYLERAEHTARLIDVDFQLRLDQSPEAGSGRWLRLLEALQAPRPEDGKIDATTLTHILTLDKTNPSSIISCVAAARENLRQVREQCSSEMWEQLNRLYLQVNSTISSEAWLLHSYVFFRAVQEGAHLFQGVTDSTMSHGEGWQYIQLGRYVERTDALARLIGTHLIRLRFSLDQSLDQAVESEEYLEWVG